MKYDPKTMFFHFTDGNKLRDGSPVPPRGEWLKFSGSPLICERGLHASRHPFDALKYAPGANLHLVKLGKIYEEHDDKVVSDRRLILASVDAENLLFKFARDCALDVIHLWKAPDIVRQFLATGDAALRDAAGAAAWAAAGAAKAAAGVAARAARDAAGAASWDAAWDAAWAARAAAWAARDARDAAWAAAGAAAGAAARAAARAARAARDARAASWDAQKDRFLAHVLLNLGIAGD